MKFSQHLSAFGTPSAYSGSKLRYVVMALYKLCLLLSPPHVHRHNSRVEETDHCTPPHPGPPAEQLPTLDLSHLLYTAHFLPLGLTVLILYGLFFHYSSCTLYFYSCGFKYKVSLSYSARRIPCTWRENLIVDS